MSAVTLLLGIHHHQPVGNFEHVFRLAYDRCYRPFIETLEWHPGIRLSLHYTGPLLDWFEKEEPGFLERLRALVRAGQVEILGGGFYEPILSVIPDRDAVGQVNHLSQRVHARVGAHPQGLWLAERVWDGSLPKKLAPTGLRYTIVDDSHFARAGFDPEALSGYYLTEREGSTLAVFPISKDLRYLIPFRLPDELIAFLNRVREHEGGGVVTYADDGEKFGLWPGTYHWVYEEGYLERLFTTLEQHADWIHLRTFSDYMREHRPTGRAYLPSASYEEMLEWSGGLWDKFFVKYPESNHLHKRMLDVSERVAHRVANEQVSEARELLWKAQGNDVYWHGLFGGLYLNNLRHEAYRNLIAAESHLDHAAHIQDRTTDWVDIRILDLDKDGDEEVIVATPTLGLSVAPAYGGSLLELDYRPARFNLLNVLARRPEAYHQKVLEASAHAVSDTGPPKPIHEGAKEAGLDQILIYDRHRRVSFLDRFLDPDTSWEALDRIDDFERGNCVQGRYQMGTWRRKQGRLTLPLTFAGAAQLAGEKVPVFIGKTYRVSGRGEGVAVSYQLENQSQKACEVRFGIELNITLLAGDDPQRYYEWPGQRGLRLRERGEYRGAQWFALVDEWHRFRVVLRIDRPHDVWYAPIETVSQSEEGFERNYQGSAILLSCCLTLRPGKAERLEAHLEISEA